MLNLAFKSHTKYFSIIITDGKRFPSSFQSKSYYLKCYVWLHHKDKWQYPRQIKPLQNKVALLIPGTYWICYINLLTYKRSRVVPLLQLISLFKRRLKTNLETETGSSIQEPLPTKFRVSFLMSWAVHMHTLLLLNYRLITLKIIL